MITLRQLREYSYFKTIDGKTDVLQSTWYHVPKETAYTTRTVHNHGDLLVGGGKFKSLIRILGGEDTVDQLIYASKLVAVYMSIDSGAIENRETGQRFTAKHIVYLDKKK